MAVKRTFGWVQNPGDLKKLKKGSRNFQSRLCGKFRFSIKQTSFIIDLWSNQ